MPPQAWAVCGGILGTVDGAEADHALVAARRQLLGEPLGQLRCCLGGHRGGEDETAEGYNKR